MNYLINKIFTYQQLNNKLLTNKLFTSKHLTCKLLTNKLFTFGIIDN